MEILLTSVTPCGLRCSLISSREHDARSGDFITPFKKFRVGWGYIFMLSFPNCFHFSVFSDCFWFVVCIIMVLFIAFLILIGLQCISFVFWIRNGDSLVIGVSSIELIEVFICFVFTFWFCEGSFHFFVFFLGYIFIGHEESLSFIDYAPHPPWSPRWGCA